MKLAIKFLNMVNLPHSFLICFQLFVVSLNICSAGNIEEKTTPKDSIHTEYKSTETKTLQNQEPAIGEQIKKTDGLKSFLRAHEAEYKIELAKNTNEDILDVTGILRIRLLESGGWAMEEHSTLTITFIDGTTEVYETSSTSWESALHDEYHFTVSSESSGKENSEQMTIRGKSKITPTESQVIYEAPEPLTVEVPRDVVFPIHLTEILLQDGANLKDSKRISRSVNLFDGSNDLCRSICVNAVLIPKKPNIKINGVADLDFNKAYLLQMAAHDSKKMEPTYSTFRVIQQNGIILSLEMDFPEIGFTTKAQLTKVNVYKPVPVAQQDRAQDS